MSEFEIRERVREPSLGKALEAFRACEEMTQEELGDKAGIAANLIDLIEKEKIIPSFSLLREIAIALNYGPEVFELPYVEALRSASTVMTSYCWGHPPTPPTRELFGGPK